MFRSLTWMVTQNAILAVFCQYQPWLPRCFTLQVEPWHVRRNTAIGPDMATFFFINFITIVQKQTFYSMDKGNLFFNFKVCNNKLT